MSFHHTFNIADQDLGNIARDRNEYYWERLKQFYNQNPNNLIGQQLNNNGEISTPEQFCNQASAIRRMKATYRHHQGFGSGLFGGLNPFYRAQTNGAVIQALTSNSRNAVEASRNNSASSATLEQLGLERFTPGN